MKEHIEKINGINDNLISVIIPAFNVEQYIGRSIDSVLGQTYQNVEIIIVDDGSVDHTAEIIDAYASKDQRVHSFHKPNGGVSSARIEGLRHATGEYITFVDGDDYIEPDMYLHLMENALKYDADISHCGYKMVFPGDRVDLYYGTYQLHEMNHDEGLLELLKGTLVEPGIWNKLYRKDIVLGFNESELWDSNIRINEDLLMNYIFFKKANTSVFEDIPFYHYMMRSNSSSNKKNNIHNYIDPLRVIERIHFETANYAEINSIVYERYLRALINVSSQKIDKNEAVKAHTKLRNETRSDYFKKIDISKKMKYMAICDSYSPFVYRIVRYMYDTIKGNRKKYEIKQC